MNAMDYEKKYNEALNLAKSYYGEGCNEFLDTIFPELAESEDERIRRALIEFCKAHDGIFPWAQEFTFSDILAYLEKQKPAEWNEEQLEADLEEAAAAIILKKHPIMKDVSTMEMAFYEMLELVKAGYELGLNARKEDEK